MSMTRVLALTAGIVNTICMFVAQLTDDWYVFTAGWLGAAVSFYAWLFFTDDAHDRGETRMGFQSLAMRLRWDIKEEGLLPGHRLPSTAELARRHDTTRTTVMRAMRILAEEGLVEIIQGRGTYVVDNGLIGERTDKPKDIIERDLMSYPRGETLPSMQQLITKHQVSGVTIRRVQARLVEQGVLLRTRAGTYVRA
jgi:DNA-binding GntR family transcriptional regulator